MSENAKWEKQIRRVMAQPLSYSERGVVTAFYMSPIIGIIILAPIWYMGTITAQQVCLLLGISTILITLISWCLVYIVKLKTRLKFRKVIFPILLFPLIIGWLMMAIVVGTPNSNKLILIVWGLLIIPLRTIIPVRWYRYDQKKFNRTN